MPQNLVPQDLEKQEAAADKRREALMAELGGVKAQLGASEAAAARLQADKEKTQLELHAKQGAVQPCSSQKHHCNILCWQCMCS